MLYLLKLLYLLIFGIVVIFTYYFTYPFHQESFSGYTPYVISLIIFYLIYKSFNYIKNEKEIKFTPFGIFSYFLLHLFLLSILFFTLNGDAGILGISLFFKIIGYMILPIIITLSNVSFGKFLTKKISGFKDETEIFQFLSSLGIGFFAFLTILTLFGFAGLYNFYVVCGIIGVFIGIGRKEFLEISASIFTYKIKLKDHNYKSQNFLKIINLKLLTTEFLFIILTFLLSVNLINIVRPMPIGWDDMGVYMNYPNLLASAGSIINLGGMLSWNIFTGIGYMLNSATQAFFLNNVGGVLGVLVIVLSFYDLLKSKLKTFINIPLLTGTIFASVPMVIFQQAKDMKLDPGLFFVSAIVIYMVLYIYLKYFLDEKKDIFKNKTYLIYIFIIGILAGFAFSIKITSLLLISGIIGIMFFAKLGIAGFLAYLSFYIGIFTKAGLWSMMNVVYPKDDILLINNIFIFSFIVGFILLAYSFKKYSFTAISSLFKIIGILILGIILSLTPWFIKNIGTLSGDITISGIINGKGIKFEKDYTKIYSQEELENIKKNFSSFSMSVSGTTQNEDFGRYFGYEKGINNYLKLPYNLTMQSNQRGEYTDITFIFLALIPALLLFLPYRHIGFVFGSFALSSSLFIWFFSQEINTFVGLNLIPDINIKLTEIFSKIELPIGYVIISLFFIIPFLYLIYTLNKEKIAVLFKLNLVFLIFYIFLWSISAFGIVWYGIAMYYSLLLFIGIGIYGVSGYDNQNSEKEIILKFFGSLVVLFVVFTYFFNSSFPHGFTNLKTSGYNNFKAGITDNYTTIFDSQPYYFEILSELNISLDKKSVLFEELIKNIKNPKIKEIITSNNINSLVGLGQILKELSNLKNENQNIEIIQIKKEATNLRSNLYKNILYPKDEYKNTIGIYRIGTFLKYFVSDNHKRLLEDSLITEFDRYFFDENDINIGVERMKKIGVDYFLVDLNAATIDKDPRRDLTRRFETLLQTFTSDNLELISTDSLCLQTALETYKKGLIDINKYISLAGVNYESYTSSGETINRGIKQLNCYNKILELMQENKIDEQNYSYLLPIQNYISQNKISSQEGLFKFFRNYVNHGWLALFKIK